MNFSEDRGVGIIDLLTKFQLNRFISDGDLSSDRNLWKDTQTHKHSLSLSHTHTHTHRLNLILYPYMLKGSSNNGEKGKIIAKSFQLIFYLTKKKKNTKTLKD